MVMAGTAPGPATDVSLSARLQWLQQRREQLQEKLALKNSELKNLCLDEAELTGILPPEIPLEPGESPPAFRKRVGTCLAYPQNLINRLKTNEAEESTLELERQIQVGIAETSLLKLNDPAESKTVRRKNRSIYQQSQRRLRELDARLSFIRQAYGRIQRQTNPLESSSHIGVDVTQTSAKHRTKKPRPPLDSLGYDAVAKTLPPRNTLQESGGVSLSPSGIESQLQNHGYRQSAWSPRGYRAGIVDDDSSPTGNNLSSDVRNFNQPLVGSSVDTVDRSSRRRNPKYPEHDHNDNHDVYILPDRYRQRTYSQGNNNAPVSVTGPKYCQDTERTYRTIPNTYTEEERQMRYRQMQQKRHLESYSSRHNIQDSQPVLHQKPPVPHNYPGNYHHHHHHHHHHQQQQQQQQQQPYLDNQSSQPSYYQSDEFVNRPTNRYVNTPDDQGRLSQRKNPPPNQQRGGRERRETVVPLNRLSRTNLQESTRSDGQLAAGYWIRENDEIVWCTEESPTSERFGSLDRRKYSAQCCAPYNTILPTKERGGVQDERERYGSTGARDYVLGLAAGPSKFSSSSAVTSHHQNYNSQVHQQIATTMNPTSSCYERVSPPPLPAAPRTLLRTQSLGSVETWQQQQNIVIVTTSPAVGQEISQTRETASIRDDDCGTLRRGKEKEWYETSMDSSYSVLQATAAATTIPTGFEFAKDPAVAAAAAAAAHREISLSRQIAPSSPRHAASRSVQVVAPPPPPPPPPPPSPPLPSSSLRDPVPGPRATCETRVPVQRIYNQQNVHRHPTSSPKQSLEIPAESKPERRRNVDDPQQAMGVNAADRSPDICTIVQAGKYQPYREVTKPFEMSDFYKYSTKYRKRTEQAATSGNTTSNVPPTPNGEQKLEDDVAGRRRHETTLRDEESTNLLVNPVQRRIYEPVQRMTCQPYGNLTRRTAMESEEQEWRGTNNNRSSAEDSTVV